MMDAETKLPRQPLPYIGQQKAAESAWRVFSITVRNAKAGDKVSRLVRKMRWLCLG
jgi:hypothetical protein